MIHEETWELEHINWADPRNGWDIFQEAIGATSNQVDQKTNSSFSVIRYVDPDKLLYYIDPFFDPEREDTVDFLMESIENGELIAIPQVWITPDEYSFFPKDAWFSKRGQLLRQFKPSKRPSRNDFEDKHLYDIVRQHEGRHRTWVARELGETVIPVQMWVVFK